MNAESGDDLRALRDWLAEAAAKEAATSRVRSRSLLQQAAEDATFTGTLVDLAEQELDVSVITVAGSVLVGRIAGVGRDFVTVAARGGRTSFLPLRAVAAVRSQSRTGTTVVGGDRDGPLQTSLAAVVSELAAERARVHATCGGLSVVGEMRSSGDDVLVVMADGVPPVATYLALNTITELAVIDLL